MIKKKEMCFRSYRPISRIIFTNRKRYLWNLEASARSTTRTVTDVKTSLSLKSFYSHWLLSNIIFIKCLRNVTIQNSIFLSIGIIIEKKKGKVARSMLPANIYSGSINTRFYTCILNTCATYLCIRYGIKYFMA